MSDTVAQLYPLFNLLKLVIFSGKLLVNDTVENLICNQWVSGSNPARLTINIKDLA